MTLNTLPVEQKRWYEQKPEVARAINGLLVCDDTMQLLISRGIGRLIKNRTRGNGVLKPFTSLGLDKITSLNKSKQCKRTYDRLLPVHHLLNEMAMLPEDKQVWAAQSLVELAGVLSDYRNQCRQSGQPPEQACLERLVNIYISSGLQSAQQTAQFYTGLLQQPKKPYGSLNPLLFDEEDDWDYSRPRKALIQAMARDWCNRITWLRTVKTRAKRLQPQERTYILVTPDGRLRRVSAT